MENDQLLVHRNNRAGILTLNRPDALNALSGEMLTTLSQALTGWERHIDIYAVVLESSSSRAFCAGGDVRHLQELGPERADEACAYLRREYRYNWQLDHFTKPHIALIDGYTLGGGVGVCLYGTHRVAGAGFSMGMPETAIGFVPDVGGSYFLGHMPGSIGLYLALTGRSIDRNDAYYLGLVTHLIDAEHFADIKRALSEAEPVDALLDGLHQEPEHIELKPLRSWIEAVFSASTLPEIFQRAKDLDDDTKGWSGKVLEELQQKSPTSLHLALQLWKRGRKLNLHRALKQEYKLACQVLRQHDFHEGIRAMLVDKDKAPRWQPASIDDLSHADINAYFDHDGYELELEQKPDAMVSA